MRSRHIYSAEQIAWLRKNRNQWVLAKVVENFNAKFKTGLSKSAINSTCKRLKIYTGRTGLFTKGGTSWNAGLKIGNRNGNRSTQFKKGASPRNTVPVGTELTRGDGYIWRKIAEPNQWRQKHRLLWEEKHGPIQAGMRLVFKDGDRTNFAEDNFELVTNAELLRLCKNNYLQQPEQLKPVVMTLSKLEVRIFEKANRVEKIEKDGEQRHGNC